MAAKAPLPARILIPVANPMTAEELIRLGAAMLDRRAGELSALGIVEVPEGMPLSEGATRARHARRLLQRVLDYAPDGTTIHPIVRIGRHAAEGIIEASAEQEADLIIFGWGGRAAGGRDGTGPTVFSPTIDEVVRESPCDIAVVKQRGSKDDPAGPRPGPRRAARRARPPLRRRHRPPPRRDRHGPPPRPARDHPRRPGPGRARARRVHQAAHHGQERGRPARGAQRPQRDPARGGEGGPRRHGRVRVSPAGPTARPTCSGPCRRRSPPGPSRRSWSSRPARRSSARRSTSWPPAPRRSPPPTGPPRRPAPSRSGSSAGSANRTSTTPSSPTCAGSSRSRRSRS